MSEQTRLRLDTLLNEQKSIFIRNLQKGIIVISASESNGRPVRIVIPKTKHPFCLSDRFTRFSLENSQSLKSAIAGGSLELLDPAKAEAELENPAVRQQLQMAIGRVSNRASEVSSYRGQRKNDITESSQPTTPIAMDAIGEVTAAAFGETKAQAAAQVDPHAAIGDANEAEDDNFGEFSQKVNPRIITLCGLVLSKDVSMKEAMIELNNGIEDHSTEDLDYLIANTNGKLRVWAEAALAQRMGQHVPAELLEVEPVTEAERKAAEKEDDDRARE